MKQSVYVKGSNGFIGENLVKELITNDYSVERWNRSEKLSIQKSDFVVHLAARVHRMVEGCENPGEDYKKSNYDLTLRLAEEALSKKIKKFIFLSSVKVFGEDAGAFDIESKPNPIDLYGKSKLDAEIGLQELFSRQSQTRCIIIRLPMVYGQGNKGNMELLLKSAKKKIPLPLAFAKGKRSMIFVGNVCSAITNILMDQKIDRPVVQKYFITDGLDLTSGELYSLIYQTMHKKKGLTPLPEVLLRLGGNLGSIIGSLFHTSLPINNGVISRLFDEYRFSSLAFCRDYQWMPVSTPKEGIQATVDWFLRQ